MKSMTCCFTGNRSIADDDLPELQKRLEEQVEKLILQGVSNFRAGRALGFDTLAAQTV